VKKRGHLARGGVSFQTMLPGCVGKETRDALQVYRLSVTHTHTHTLVVTQAWGSMHRLSWGKLLVSGKILCFYKHGEVMVEIAKKRIFQTLRWKASGGESHSHLEWDESFWHIGKKTPRRPEFIFINSRINNRKWITRVYCAFFLLFILLLFLFCCEFFFVICPKIILFPPIDMYK